MIRRVFHAVSRAQIRVNAARICQAPQEGQESISGIGGQTTQCGAGEGQESLNEMLIQATEVRAL